MRALWTLVCAVAVGCAQPTPEKTAPVSVQGGTSPTAVTSQGQLRDDMRRLWTDHVAYTRFYIMESEPEEGLV